MCADATSKLSISDVEKLNACHFSTAIKTKRNRRQGCVGVKWRRWRNFVDTWMDGEMMKTSCRHQESEPRLTFKFGRLMSVIVSFIQRMQEENIYAINLRHAKKFMKKRVHRSSTAASWSVKVTFCRGFQRHSLLHQNGIKSETRNAINTNTHTRRRKRERENQFVPILIRLVVMSLPSIREGVFAICQNNYWLWHPNIDGINQNIFVARRC